MKQIVCNGMPAPSFFPTNLLLHMQTTQEEYHLHPPHPPPSNPLLSTNPCSNLQDFRGTTFNFFSTQSTKTLTNYEGKFTKSRDQTKMNSFLSSLTFSLLHTYINAAMAPMLGKRPMQFPGMEPCEDVANGEDDLSDDCSQAGEKKRRLNIEQVRTLEKNFELGNKLEPERKMQLARALGLQPRQIAIWFQNRRARWKTKQLEKDYDTLKRQFEAVKSENEALQAQNKKLQAEVRLLSIVYCTV